MLSQDLRGNKGRTSCASFTHDMLKTRRALHNGGRSAVEAAIACSAGPESYRTCWTCPSPRSIQLREHTSGLGQATAASKLYLKLGHVQLGQHDVSALLLHVRQQWCHAQLDMMVWTTCREIVALSRKQWVHALLIHPMIHDVTINLTLNLLHAGR